MFQTSLALADLTAVLSYIPESISNIVQEFYKLKIPFDINHPDVPKFYADSFKTELPESYQKLIVSLFEGARPGEMIIPMISRQSNAICVLQKHLSFSREQKQMIANALRHTPIFVEDLNDPVQEVFEKLINSKDNLIIFDFPRTLTDLIHIYRRFEVPPQPKSLIPKLTFPSVTPFDAVFILDISDEIILRDVLATIVDPQTQQVYDARTLDLNDAHVLSRLVPKHNEFLDIEQFCSRTEAMKRVFKLVSEHFDETVTLTLDSRTDSSKVTTGLRKLSIPPKSPPIDPVKGLYFHYIELAAGLSSDMKESFCNIINLSLGKYEESLLEIFDLLNQTRLILIDHLRKARIEMAEYLERPSSSQSQITEFQTWHSSQVKRQMRKIPKVKEECLLRLNILREILDKIDTDRKAEEELKQKELLNVNFQLSLFEIVTNIFALFIQVEVDRWSSSRAVLTDFNQILSQSDMVPQVARKKIGLSLDANKKKPVQKKALKPVASPKTKLDAKLPAYESPLFDQFEPIKKHVTDTAVCYNSPPVDSSSRPKSRVVKDKSQYAAHKFQALEEFLQVFQQEDIYFFNKLDHIARMLRDELDLIQNSFDAYVEYSTQLIQANFDKRRRLADTVVGHLMQRVNEEAQVNYFILMKLDKVVIDKTKLFIADEHAPYIPPQVPSEIGDEALVGGPESLFTQLHQFLGYEKSDTDN